MKDMKMRAWIIPTLTDSYSDGKIVKVNTIHLGKEKVQIGYKKIYDGDKVGGNISIPFSHIELMQFIGLKDRNNKDIYEGDIVKSWYPYNDNYIENTDIVEWNDEECSFMLGSKRHFHKGLMLEVLGNIYENPELLLIGEDAGRAS